MSELARGGIVSGTGFTGWFEPEGLETFIPLNAEQVERIRRNAGIIAANLVLSRPDAGDRDADSAKHITASELAAYAAHKAALNVEPITFDSMGSPIFAHQIPPEEPSDER